MATHRQRVAVAKQIARWLRRTYGEAIEDVRLYGSVARGTDSSTSDIDILILASRPLTDVERDELSRRAYDEDLKYGTVTQCLVRTVDEWRRPEVQCGGLAREVAREGVAL